LSEEKETSKTDSTPLFENKFAFINEEGELVLKKTAYFDQRKIGKIDPDSVEELVETLENAFEDVRVSIDDFFKELEEETDLEADAIKNKFDELQKSILSADAIGDFEELISDVNERFVQAVSSEKDESVKPEETSAESTEKSAGEPDAETTKKTSEEEVSEKETSEEVKTEDKQTDTDLKTEPEPVEKLAAEDPESKADTDTSDVKEKDADDKPFRC